MNYNSFFFARINIQTILKSMFSFLNPYKTPTNLIHERTHTKTNRQFYCPCAIQTARVVARKPRAEDHAAEV